MSDLTPLKEYVTQWTNQELDYENIISIGRDFYLVTAEVKATIEQLDRPPHSAGIHIGTFHRTFTPSLALINIIGKTTTKKIIVEDKQGWLFICGRDLFTKDLPITETLRHEQQLIIQNEHGDILGLAQKKRDKTGKSIFAPVIDLGDYIRRDKR